MEDTQQSAPVAAVPEVFPLDDAAIEILGEIDQQQAALNAQRQAVLGYFARQHKLQGQWKLADNHKELVKAT